MNSAQTFTKVYPMDHPVIDASQIAALDHAEAGRIAYAELDRFLALVESLSGDDWQQPTDCTDWTVRDMLAHQAGAYAGGASLAEFLHQYSARPGAGQMVVDAANARQVADRAGLGPVELISELRRVGPAAVRARQRLPKLLRNLTMPMGPPLGTVPVRYLTDLIYTRDTWMHRADICRATGKPFVQNPEHDGRMVALVLHDLAKILDSHLRGQSVVFDLSGLAGGRYRIGHTPEPSTIIKMDVLEFNRLASGRLTPEAAKAEGLVTASGDRNFADQILALTSVPY
jgi:uncharacterized protein (TIGR03083 family)